MSARQQVGCPLLLLVNMFFLWLIGWAVYDLFTQPSQTSASPFFVFLRVFISVLLIRSAWRIRHLTLRMEREHNSESTPEAS